VTSLHAILPSAALAKASTSDIKSVFGSNGLDWFSLNAALPTGSAFANILNSVTPNANANATPSSDPIAQLAALVQNGTPLSTIVNTIAQSVSGSLQTQLSGKISQSALDNLRSSLLQSITNALSPPSNAPSGTATQQVTALAARLQRLINAVAREAETTAGQQNEISGNVLDAKSAKEPPAQQKTNEAASTLDASSLVRSLLANAVATLQATGKTAEASAPTGKPVLTRPIVGPAGPVLHSQISSQLVASAASAAAPSNAPAITAAPVASTPSSLPASTDVASTSSITMANAPDLLARMIVRAAGADAAVSGSAGAATTPASTTGSNAPANAAALAARFAAAIADVVSSATDSSNAQTGGNWFNQHFESANQSTTTASTNTPQSGSNVAVAATNVNTQVQNLSQPQASLPSSVDVSSLIEQVIKSMSMRTNAQGTSQIQLHLQPANLGDVTMRITVTGNQISTSMIAQNADVRSALLANHQQLAKSLSDSGLTLTGFNVDVSGGDTKHQNQGQTSGLSRRYAFNEGNAAVSEDAAVSNLGPPLLGGASLGLFSYLA